MPRSSSSRSRRIFAALVAGVVGVVLFVFWILSSPAVPQDKTGALRKGMTGGEVEAILGRPSEVVEGEDGESEWLYESPLKRSTLNVTFSNDARVTGYRQDGLRPGKIKGACFWGLARVCAGVGAKDSARDLQFQSMCASMGCDALRYRCKDRADAGKLNSEIWKFFRAEGRLIPNYKAEGHATDDPAVLDVVVTKPSRKLLEDYLRERGYTAE